MTDDQIAEQLFEQLKVWVEAKRALLHVSNRVPNISTCTVEAYDLWRAEHLVASEAVQQAQEAVLHTAKGADLDTLRSVRAESETQIEELKRDNAQRLKTANEAITRMHAAESQVAEAEAKLRAAEQENARLREALNEYGKHKRDCTVTGYRRVPHPLHSEGEWQQKPCSCGLAALSGGADTTRHVSFACGCHVDTDGKLWHSPYCDGAGTRFTCAASRDPAGQECGWPTCGCDPYAQKVLDAVAVDHTARPSPTSSATPVKEKA